MNCDRCGEVVAQGDLFCEACGATLGGNSPAANNCQRCGAPPSKIDADRYCSECGFRQVVAIDRLELQPAPHLAGASDRGQRHHHNEDAIALKSIDANTSIIVVCDGVSSSQHPELASRIAADACLEAIAAAVERGGVDAYKAICLGIAAALEAVGEIPIDPHSDLDASSTTIVAVLVRDRVATLAWLGDSRAYWLSDSVSSQLTQDDSWLREAIESGTYTPEEAEASPYAHAIVRWLGADTNDDGTPNLTEFTMPGSGYLLLCTDGLWNYAPDPSYLYHILHQSPDRDNLAIARHLVNYANQQGGHDNITVGILAINASRSEAAND